MLFFTVCKTLQPVANTPGVLLVSKYVSGGKHPPGGEHHSGGSPHPAGTPLIKRDSPARLSFFGHKKGRPPGSMTLIRGTGRMVAGDESAKQIIAQSNCQRPTPHRPASPLRAASHSPSRGTLRHPAAKPGRRVCRQPNRRGCCRRNRPP